MKNYLLTCKTDGCLNKDIAIEYATEATVFICGVCSVEITDVQIVKV
jgi:hypothetical protein